MTAPRFLEIEYPHYSIIFQKNQPSDKTFLFHIFAINIQNFGKLPFFGNPRSHPQEKD